MVYSHKGDMHVVAGANWTCLKDFFGRGKWGKSKERKEDGRNRKGYLQRGGSRNPVILFIMYSQGEERMG